MLVTKIVKLSSTSYSFHQHISSPTSVTNIDVIQNSKYLHAKACINHDYYFTVQAAPSKGEQKFWFYFITVAVMIPIMIIMISYFQLYKVIKVILTFPSLIPNLPIILLFLAYGGLQGLSFSLLVISYDS